MTDDLGFTAVVAWSAFRSAVAAAVAVACGAPIARELGRGGPAGRMLWAAVVLAVVMPDLIVGYGYSNFALSLLRHPRWNEACVTALIACKTTAVAAALLRFSPRSPLTASGAHLLRLAGGRIGPIRRAAIVLCAQTGRLAPAAAVAFLFAFQQFELPSLMNATAWTVSLFDRQALLPDLADSAALLPLPVLLGLIALVPAVACVLRLAGNGGPVPSERRSPTSRSSAWTLAAAAVGLAAIVPFGIVLRESVGGWGGVVVASGTVREVTTALLLGTASGMLAYAAAAGLLRATTGPRAWGVPLLVLALLPGLCGPLAPSLAVVAALQHPILLPFRDTLLPLVAVLVASLLPRAVLLAAIGRPMRRGSTAHLARLLQSSADVARRRNGARLLWRLDGFGRFCRVGLLAYWGYLDLTAATILAPPAVVPVSARLYNLMHYGHNAALSALSLVALAAPAVAFAAAVLIRLSLLRWLAR